MKDFTSNFDDNSVPNDELGSANLISEPDDIEDSQASDFKEIREKNQDKHRRQITKTERVDQVEFNVAGSSSKRAHVASSASKKSNQEPRIYERDIFNGFEAQITEKDSIAMSLAKRSRPIGPTQEGLFNTVAHLDLNCSKEFEGTP